MKHRLPKPKLSRQGTDHPPSLEQSELLVDDKNRAPETGADMPPQSPPPYSFELNPPVNESPTIPVSSETTPQQGNDSFNAPPPLPSPTESFIPSHSNSGYGQTSQPPMENPVVSTLEPNIPPTDSPFITGPENPSPIETKAFEPALTEPPFVETKAITPEPVSTEPAPVVENKPAATPPPLPVKEKTESRATPPPLPAPKAGPPPLPIPVTVIAKETTPAPELTISSEGLKPSPTPTETAPSPFVVYERYVPPDNLVPKEEKKEESKPALLSTPSPAPLPPSTPANDHAPFLIQTRGLVKQYGGRRVVNGVDIHVRAGEVVGLLGKNGAGKTTTFYMIVGLVPPTEGHVYMGDEDVTRMPMYRRARRGIGYLPQEESIFRKLTVEENLLAILETLPMTEDERDARCDELLKDFGLEHVRENVTITLSGGEKRRVTIARALVTNPSLLLLDEPFSGVDPMAVHDIQEIILHLKERGLGVLITDHNVRETLSVVDRAYIIDEGRVLSEGSREFLLNDPIAREIYLGHRFSM